MWCVSDEGSGTTPHEGVEPMGRGRAKAKQVKVARQLKYNSGGTDLDRLRDELGVGDPDRNDDTDDLNDELADRYADYADDYGTGNDDRPSGNRSSS
ncbi:hypothetical protein GCM10012289_00430 [Nonomuraea cavernae]|uniref:DUF3073 domain-containing protein n=2 Tax=Nonomuraea cavernae TaxID=2045107 RepID=A0A917YPU2_9ACTN|nr:hypothetical protein GCM10012289_00430 [Nonomuraea cavernae]